MTALDVYLRGESGPIKAGRGTALTGGQGGSAGSAVSTYLIPTVDALARSDVVVVSSVANYYQSSIGTAHNRTYDARSATLAATPHANLDEADSYVVKIGDTADAQHTVWVGGLIRTDVPLTHAWHEVKGSYDGAGILFWAENWFVCDGVRFYNVQDALRPRLSGTNKKWAMRNCWGQWIRDDFNENDGTGSPGGQIHDCLCEGAFMFLSCGQNQTWDGSEDMTIRRTLIHLDPMPYTNDVGSSDPYLNSTYGDNADRHGHPFKQHSSSATDYPIHLIDSLLFIEQHSVDGQNQDNEDLLVNVAGSTATNTALIWIGPTGSPQAYPGALPAGITEYNLLTNTEAELRAAWAAWANNWKTRHGFASGADILDAPLDAAKMIAPADFAVFDAANLI